MLCIKEIEIWLSSNHLKLNTNKTKFIWLRTKQQLTKVYCQTINLEGTIIPMSTEVTCLGVVLDNELKFATHTKMLSGCCFYQLEQLRTIWCIITTDAAKTLAKAFITSRVTTATVYLNIQLPYICFLYNLFSMLLQNWSWEGITSHQQWGTNCTGFPFHNAWSTNFAGSFINAYTRCLHPIWSKCV